ncbi:MAG: YdbH domain-containing protein [Xanthomonadales bacterium]|nr:YdbH domain-containing protein [Xanthomonadales bacterium]
MKLLLKLFLILCLVLAGIYAATPLWLPNILARQLPTGWQLEELQSGYPGLSGINAGLLRVKGTLAVADIALTSTDILFTYEGLRTDIGQVSLDIYLRTTESDPDTPPTVNDLSLPVVKLTSWLPQLSVGQMRVALHQAEGVKTATVTPARPVVLDFKGFNLNPRLDQSFHLASQVSFEDYLRFTGQLEVDASPGLINAGIRFPAAEDSSWLAVQLRQEELPENTITHIDVVLNTDSANRDWLDLLLASGTGRMFTQLGGSLQIRADFSGRDLQKIEHLSLSSENLHLVSDGGTLDINVNLLVSREDQKIVINLPTPAKFEYQGKTTWIDELLISAIPGLQVTSRKNAKISAELNSNSRFLFLPDTRPSISFEGDFKFDMSSSSDRLRLQSTDIQVDMADLNKPESTTADGLLKVDWDINAPIGYRTEDLQLTVDKLSIKAELISGDEKLISTGGGTLMQAHINPLDYSADRIEMTWQDLDLINLTGNLGTRTQGFNTRLDNETWTGFDFDINYVLLSNFNVDGSGKLKFSSGPELPLEFTGNTDSQRWDIKLPPATIQLSKLRKLLAVAHVEMPAAIKLKDGYIELQGNILVGDDIAANMNIAGYGMHALMHESSALDASFTFNTGYDSKLRAKGPLSIGVLALAGGIDVANIRSELALESVEHFELKDFYAEVFDGQLVLGSLQFSENKIAETTVELSHISLSQLLAFAEINGLDGTGFLDISLPLGSDEAGIHVNNGVFRATAPGRLAYKNQGISSSNIGLQAMENFQYKDLSGTLNYQSDGTYLISVRLEGKNPDLYGGHPVVFNLNINGLLPAFFESMFMTGSFEESILNEIKSKQKPKETP